MEPITYIRNIEQRIIEQIEQARHSIHIIVAWFTSGRIRAALIERAQQKPTIKIQIVVDDNEVNRLHFFSKAHEMEAVGIVIKPKITQQFLHQKSMIIDCERVMSGSYNFTDKANTNREHMTLLTGWAPVRMHLGEFQMLTNDEYIDDNVSLLLKYPLFAQQLLSTYYCFAVKEMNKYKSRITLGYCYLAFNGYHDHLYWEPGFIFNRICNSIEYYGFELPIKKSDLEKWHEGLVVSLGSDYYHNYPDNLDGLSDYMDENYAAVESYYKRKYEQVYPGNVLEEKILSGVNIIVESHLWPQNFQPYINSRVLNLVMQAIPDLDENESWIRGHHLIKRQLGVRCQG
jgi:hypothetical protein